MKYFLETLDEQNIKDMAVRDRPRERMKEFSARNLNDLELIMILLGSGSREHPVRSLAKKVLALLDANDEITPQMLESIDGIGSAKACLISAAVELGRRQNKTFRKPLSRTQDVYDLVRHYASRPQEQFISAAVNGANELLDITVVSLGTLDQAPVHPREVYAPAIQARASGIIVAHNHPSGNLNPSPADLDATRRLSEAGKILGIRLIDHVIFSEEGFFSLYESGLML